MGKRFTDTAKWDKKWFRRLSPQDKLAWVYLCDQCDAAGVIDIDEDAAQFKMGQPVDWDGFVSRSDGRVERLPSGRLWLTTFVEFQYPHGLSDTTNAHKPVLASLCKNDLVSRVHELLPDSKPTLLDKDKDTDKDNDSRKEIVKRKPNPFAAESVPVPEGFEIAEVRTAIADWLTYKARRGKPYKDASYLGRKVSEFLSVGPEAFVAAVNSSIGNNYDGIYPARDTNGNTKPARPTHRYRG